MEELIRKLVEAYGPSGFEDGVRDLIADEIRAHADEVRVDGLGNLIARKRGGDGRLKVMIAAHMDEIGVMVTHITEKGFLRFTNIGGVFPPTLLGNRVQFADGRLGVVAAEMPEDRGKVQGLDRHYIDVGAGRRQDSPVQVGAAAGFSRPLVVQDSRLTAKSMDDRIGCAVAVETLRRLEATPHDVYFVFSVQEEVGTRGAQTAANALAPDVGIAVDVTLTGDMLGGPHLAMELGNGPAIKVKDGGMIAHAGLVRALRAAAESHEIAYQMEVLEGGSTDARAMQVAGAGCAASCISIPCRYVHTQSETVDAADVENAVRLLVAFLAEPISL
ncbi:MAG: M42 family metallopeptidase [Candidatus Promineifilaceae bacterium]